MVDRYNQDLQELVTTSGRFKVKALFRTSVTLHNERNNLLYAP